MKIETITLEGFKSYKTKVVVGPLSDNFNAVFGENGSGKSNLFDAICFVLGMRSTNDMRVENLEDFIYKKGSQGVTSASVSILFDNSDKSCSPIMYQNEDKILLSRQIVIKGRNRYFINGVLSKPVDVQRMLQETHINVSNGNFIVLQGKIQKIVSLKPLELLEMLGESLGTSMFDREREKSEKTLNEKQLELSKIEKDLNEMLEPTLKKCMEHKENYLTWMNLGVEIDVLSEKLQMIEMEDNEKELKLLNDTIRSLESELDCVVNNIQFLSQKITSYQEKLEQNLTESILMDKNNNCSEDREKLSKLKNQIAEVEIHLTDIIEISEKHKSTILQLNQEKQKIKLEIENYEKENSKVLQIESEAKTSVDENEKKLKILEKQLIAAANGECLTEKGEEMLKFIQNLKDEIFSLNLELTAIKTKLSLNKDKLSKLEKSNDCNDMKIPKIMTELEDYEKKLLNIQNDIDSCQFDQNALRKLENERNALKKLENEETQLLQRFMNRFRIENAILEYFKDRNKVLGPVVDCFKVKNGFENYILAIEEIAKSKLTQIVVDNDETAIEILKFVRNSGLRATCIPINKIIAKPVDQKTLNHAHGIPNDNVMAAFELIEFDEKLLANVFAYVLSNSFVCTSNESAKKLLEDKNWKYNVVTEDGSSYSPSGQITGGSCVGMNNFIIERHKSLALIDKINNYKKKGSDLESIHNNLIFKERNFNDLISLKNITTERIAQIQLELKILKSSSIEGEIFKIKQDSKIFENKMIEIDDSIKRKQKVLKINEASYNQFLENRNKYTNSLKQDLEICKDKLANDKKKLESYKKSDFEKKKNNNQNNITRLDYIINKVNKLEAELSEFEKKILILQSDLEELREAYNKYFISIESWAKKKSELEKTSMSFRNEINCLKNSLDQLESEKKKLKTKISTNFESHDELRKIVDANRQYDIKKKQKIRINNQENLEQILDKYEIEEKNSEKISNIISTIRNEKNKLQMSIDKQSISLLAVVERKYQELLASKAKIENERDSVIKLIDNIKQQKVTVLIKTFEKLNLTFSYIYSQLVYEAKAELTLINESNIEEGFEMTVIFNGTKKKTLTDLSGGQKTIISLCLTLSFLKLTPAPFYIFDEVDAALDISYSAHLGTLIKKFFNNSQIIIISHRQALYKAADKIFTTKCYNGISVIEEISAI